MLDGDPQARAKDRDRDQAIYVISAALRNGQISQQDHDLRVERVQACSTVGDLSALVRDIATAPAHVPPTAVVPPPVVVPLAVSTGVGASPYAPGSVRPADSVPSDLYGPQPSAKKHTPKTVVTSGAGAKKFVFGCVGVVFLFTLAPIIFGVIIFAVQNHGGTDFTQTAPEPVGPPFELTGPGLREFVTRFKATFDDTEVVRAVFYDGYVVAWVPDGKGHESIWDYSDGAFSQLGAPMDGTSETAPVDLADLRPAKVIGLIRTADETLGVTNPTTTYVILDRGLVTDAPQLAVYVNNDAGDSGFLLADLDGTVQYTAGAG